MRLVGLCGYAGSGKDEAAKALTAIGWQRVAFADAVREVALAINPIVGYKSAYTYHSSLVGPVYLDGRSWWKPWTWLAEFAPLAIRLADVVAEYGWLKAKKRDEVRYLLQAIGTEAGRNILGENIWVDAAIRKSSGDTVFTDVRFPNEVAAIRERNGILVRITRPGVGPVNGHASETIIDGIAPDFTIDNCEGADELHRALLEVVELATWHGETELPPFSVVDDP